MINNAGVMAPRTFQRSEDGVEGQFAANYLGHFLLTCLLIDRLVAADGATVVMNSSLGYLLDEVHFEDVNFEVCGF